MKIILSEKNFVVVLFVIVVFTFSVAQNESKNIEKLYFETQVSNLRPSSIFAENIIKVSQQKRIVESNKSAGSIRKSVN